MSSNHRGRRRSSSKLVRITYGSRRSGDTALAKKLFGYKSWSMKVNGKEYMHKPIKGKLSNLSVRKMGRSRFIAPEEKLQEIEKIIESEGGVIRRVDPVTMDEREAENSAREAYKGFIDPLIEKMKYASETENKELYLSSLQSGIRLTSYFEKFLDEIDNDSDHRHPPSSSTFLKVQRPRKDQFVRRMQALESMAKEDFESAKVQTEFFAAELEDLKGQILK
jgi:hypothetical protein